MLAAPPDYSLLHASSSFAFKLLCRVSTRLELASTQAVHCTARGCQSGTAQPAAASQALHSSRLPVRCTHTAIASFCRFFEKGMPWRHQDMWYSSPRNPYWAMACCLPCLTSLQAASMILNSASRIVDASEPAASGLLHVTTLTGSMHC